MVIVCDGSAIRARQRRRTGHRLAQEAQPRRSTKHEVNEEVCYEILEPSVPEHSLDILDELMNVLAQDVDDWRTEYHTGTR